MGRRTTSTAWHPTSSTSSRCRSSGRAKPSRNARRQSPKADPAGVSRKTFYEHFNTKEDAFLAAYDELSKRLLDHVEAELSKARAFQDGVTGCLAGFLEFVASEPTFAQMCIVEILSAGPAAARMALQAADIQA